jgi:hypothetical protein
VTRCQVSQCAHLVERSCPPDSANIGSQADSRLGGCLASLGAGIRQLHQPTKLDYPRKRGGRVADVEAHPWLDG